MVAYGLEDGRPSSNTTEKMKTGLKCDDCDKEELHVWDSHEACEVECPECGSLIKRIYK